MAKRLEKLTKEQAAKAADEIIEELKGAMSDMDDELGLDIRPSVGYTPHGCMACEHECSHYANCCRDEAGQYTFWLSDYTEGEGTGGPGTEYYTIDDLRSALAADGVQPQDCNTEWSRGIEICTVQPDDDGDPLRMEVTGWDHGDDPGWEEIESAVHIHMGAEKWRLLDSDHPAWWDGFTVAILQWEEWVAVVNIAHDQRHADYDILVVSYHEEDEWEEEDGDV